MKRGLLRPEYNVFGDLDFSPEEAANLKMRSRLMMALTDLIEARGLTQAQAAKLMGVSQPRISNLVRGKIDRFSIDTLVAMLATGGARVTIAVHHASGTIKPASRRAPAPPRRGLLPPARRRRKAGAA